MDPQAHVPDVAGAPAADLARSFASRAVARLAARSELHLFDYEARVQLELPEHWLPLARPDLGVTTRAPGWERGALAEAKYLSFRHDVRVGSMHAGHRSKWTAHELCHGLVGFAWSASGSVLFHALAARMAEALPVALWYFLDEPDDERDDGGIEVRRARAREFLRREITATRASMAAGRPIATPHGTLDLMSDGLAYASAHLERLRSPELQSWVARFVASDPGTAGWHPDLESLTARVESVAAALTGDAPLESVAPWVGGHWRWVAQDLAARLLQVAADSEGECFVEIDRLVDRLVSADEASVAAVIEGYDVLFDAFDLPEPDDLFAVGYPLPHGRGRSVRQLREGLQSACPKALTAVGDLDEAVVTGFVGNVRPVSRAPLGHRFADYLDAHFPHSEAAAIARFEAAIAHAPPADALELALAWDAARPAMVRLASGVTIVRAGSDVAAIVLGGAARGAVGPHSWLVRRDAAEEVGLTAVTEACADLLARLPLSSDVVEVDDELGALIDEGFLVPDAWSLDVDQAPSSS